MRRDLGKPSVLAKRAKSGLCVLIYISPKDELGRMDAKTRKAITIHGALNPTSNIDMI